MLLCTILTGFSFEFKKQWMFLLLSLPQCRALHRDVEAILINDLDLKLSEPSVREVRKNEAVVGS